MASHSFVLCTFSISSRNRKLFKDDNRPALSDIEGSDAYDLINQFLLQYCDGKNIDNVDKETVFSVSQIYNEDRVVYGKFNSGNYGIESVIKKFGSSKVSLNRSLDDVESIDRAFFFFIPRDRPEAIMIFHSHYRDSNKTIFFKYFSEFVKAQTGFTIKYENYAYKKVLDEWRDSLVKKVVISGYKTSNDLTSSAMAFGVDKGDYTFLPPKRGFGFGPLKFFKEKYKKDIVSFEDNSDNIKVLVENGELTKTFSITSGNSIPAVKLEFEESLLSSSRQPIFDKVYEYMDKLSKDIYKEIYL